MTYSNRKIKQDLRGQKEFLLCIIVSDTTKISHLSTKLFLSSLITKNELSEYLKKKLAQCLTKEYVTVYGNSLLKNVANLDRQLFNEQLDNFTQGEAGTSIVFHVIVVTKRSIQRISGNVLWYGCSPPLLHYFEMISSSTIFKTTEHEYILQKIHEYLTPYIRKALLGFYAIWSNSEISWFLKKSCCVFVTVPNEVLEALTNLGLSNTISVADIQSIELFNSRHIPSKYPRFDNVKMAQVVQTTAGFREITTFLHHCCQINLITAQSCYHHTLSSSRNDNTSHLL